MILKRLTCAAALLALGLMGPLPAAHAEGNDGPPKLKYDIGHHHLKVYVLYFNDADQLFAIKSKELGQFSAVGDTLQEALFQYADLLQAMMPTLPSEAEFALMSNMQYPADVDGVVASVVTKKNSHGEPEEYVLKLNGHGATEYRVPDVLVMPISEEADPTNEKAPKVGKHIGLTIVDIGGGKSIVSSYERR